MPAPVKRVSKATGKVTYLANPIYRQERLGAKTFRTMAEARRYDREMVANAEKSGGTQNKLFSEAMTRYQETYTPRKKGQRWEYIRIEKFKRDPIARKKVAALTDEDFEDWIDRQRCTISKVTGEPIKDASILREFGILVQITKKCRKWKWMQHDPCEFVDRPKNSKHRYRRITPDEFEQITTRLRTMPQTHMRKSWQVAVAWELAIETGMRCSEILTLTPDQVFFEQRYVHLDETKNGDERDVPLSKRAIELLKEVPDGFTVTSKSCDPLFRKAKNKLGIENLTFHDSRHEAASRFVHAKIYDLMELCAVMGWRDYKLANVYYNPTATELAMRLDRI